MDDNRGFLWCFAKLLANIGCLFAGLIMLIVALALLFKCCDAGAIGPVHKRVAFVGDSITTGQYPIVVYDLLRQRCEMQGGRLTFTRLARKGASTKAIQRYFGDVLSRDEGLKPSYIVLYGGLNDCLRGQGHPEKRVIRRLREMIDAAYDEKVELVVLKLHVESECSAKVNSWLDSVERAQVVDTLGLRKRVDGRGRMISGDGIHLTYSGNRALAEMVYKQVDWGC